MATDTAALKTGTASTSLVAAWFDKYRLYSYGSVVLLLVVWEAAVRLLHIPPIFLPAPSAVAERAVLMFADSQIWGDIGVTLYRIFAGFLIAAVIGVPLGLWMGSSRTVSAIADLWIAFLYPIPKIAFIPLLILYLGTTDTYRVTLSIISAIFPIIINTYLGVTQVDKGLIAAARDLGASERQIQWKVVFPAALPSIFAGFRLGLGVAIILIIAAEQVASRDGIGYRIYEAGQQQLVAKVFVGLIILGILGVIVTKVQDWIDRRVTPWATTRHEE